MESSAAASPTLFRLRMGNVLPPVMPVALLRTHVSKRTEGQEDPGERAGPGAPIAAPMQDQVLTEEAKLMFESLIPRGKMGRPEEIATVALFLLQTIVEATLANEAARRLELALMKAADGCEPVTAIRKMSSAYIKFARDNPHLYEAMMSLHAPRNDATSHLSLWTFTVEQVQRIAGSDRAAQASVALWAFLHGAATLEAAQVLGEIKPASGLEFGFEARLMAVSTRREPIDALRIKPTKKSTNKKVSASERSVRSGK
jgi:hypothetical protein